MPPSIVCSTTSVTMRPIRSEDVRPSTATRSSGSVVRTQNPGPHRIVDIVIDVGDDVGDAGDLPLDRARAMLGVGADRHAALALGVARDAVAHLPRQVEPVAVVLEHVDDPQALLVVVEAAGDEVVEHALAGMPERRVPQIVAERDGLGELLVEPEHLGDAAGDLRHLERVRQAGPIVIAGRREEHLRLVLQTPERLAVDDAVAVALERRTDRVLRLGPHAGPGCRRSWPPAGARISRSRCSSCCLIVIATSSRSCNRSEAFTAEHAERGDVVRWPRC